MSKSNYKQIAYELAEALDDINALPLYQRFVEKYQKAFLYEVLAKVMSVPSIKSNVVVAHYSLI